MKWIRQKHMQCIYQLPWARSVQVITPSVSQSQYVSLACYLCTYGFWQSKVISILHWKVLRGTDETEDDEEK